MNRQGRKGQKGQKERKTKEYKPPSGFDDFSLNVQVSFKLTAQLADKIRCL